MPGKFIAANVLIYLASGDTVKADKAERVLDDVGGVISVQVLNEFVNVARRKMRLSWPEIHDTLKSLRAILRVEPITKRVHDTGLDIAERYGLSTHSHDRSLGAGGRLRDALVGGHAGWDGRRGAASGESIFGGALNEGVDRCCCYLAQILP